MMMNNEDVDDWYNLAINDWKYIWNVFLEIK